MDLLFLTRLMDLLFLIVVPSCICAFGVALCVAARHEGEERREREARKF